MNHRKIKFLRAVRLLAPHDKLVFQFAEAVNAETLPVSPGGAALELVAAFEKMSRFGCPSRWAAHPPSEQPSTAQHRHTARRSARTLPVHSVSRVRQHRCGLTPNGADGGPAGKRNRGGGGERRFSA